MRAPRDSKLRPLSVSLARFSSAVVICAAIVGAARGASTLYWDADATPGNNAASGAGLGGSGIWNNTPGGLTNWWGGVGTDSMWDSTHLPGDTAVFAGTAGTVDLGVPITVGNLIFNTSGYTLTSSSASALTFTPNAIVSLNDPNGGVVNATISAQLAGDPATGITFNGNSGTLTLNYAGTQAVTGPLNIRSGTLQVSGAVSVLDSSTGLNFKGTGSFHLDNVGAIGNTTYSLGALTNTSGNGVVRIVRTAAQNVSLSFSSLVPRVEGATGRFEAIGNGASLNGGNSLISIGGVATGFMPGYFAKSEVGLGAFAWYDAGGFVREMIYGSDLGTLSTVGAASNFQPNRHMQMTGSQTAQATQTILSLQIVGAGTSLVNLAMASGTTLTIDDGGTTPTGGPGSILKVGGDNSTISAASGTATITAGGTVGSGRELIIRTDNTADTLTIAASVSIANTTGALTKVGPGTLILNGTQSFTGTTYLNGGTLSVRGLAAASATSTAVVLNNGTYELLGYGANSTALETITTGKNITVNGASAISAGRITPLTDLQANKTVAFGTLSIGNQVLTVNPTSYIAPNPVGSYAVSFTGATTFRDALSPVFNVTGTQAVGTTEGLTLAGVISGPSGLIKRGTGTLALANSGNLFGAAAGSVVELQQGVLSIASDGALGAAANSLLLNGGSPTDELLTTATITTGRNVDLGQVTNAIEVSGAANTLTLSGFVRSNINSDLVKRGAGTLLLNNGGNTFGGPTGSLIDIQGGILKPLNVGALGSTLNTVQLNTGIFGVTATLAAPQKFNLAQTANTIDVAGAATTLTISGLVSSSGTLAGLTKTGAGSLTLTNAANSFGGPTSILDIQGGGTLTVTSGGALGDPANTVRLTGTFVGGDALVANGTSTASQNFNLAQSTVSATTATFNVPGTNTFTLAGVFSQTGALASFIKTGTGTLELTNANPLLGGGQIFDIQDGYLAAASDASLGIASNTVKIGTATNVGGFRALGSFTTARTFSLANATNKIDVTQGNALTLTTPFTLGANTNALVKDDLGTLVLNVDQPTTWTGAVMINKGTIQVLGSGVTTRLGATATATTINGIGGLELSGGVSVAEALTINTPGDNTTMAGSNFAGVLRGLSGAANNYTGAITVAGAPIADNTFRSIVFSVDGGGFFNLTSASTLQVPVSTGTGRVTNLILTSTGAGAGAGTLSGDILKSGTGNFKIVKTGSSSSTWTFNTPTALGEDAINAVEVRSGIFKVTATTASSTGIAMSSAPSLTFAGGGTFQYDNTGAGANSTSVTRAQTLGALAFSAGDGTVLLQRAVVAATNTDFLTFGSATRATGATGLFQAGGTSSTFSGTPTVKAIFSPALAVGFIDAGVFAQNNTGVTTTGFGWYDTTLTTVRPIVYGTDAGTATVANLGALTTGSHLQVAANASVTSAAGISPLSLNMLSGTTVTIAAGASLTLSAPSHIGGTAAGAILKAGLGTGTITGGTSLTTGSTSSELIIRTDAASDFMVINTPIANTGALTKSGAGQLTLNPLTGSNAWSGGTFLNGGTLVIQGAAALPAGATALGLGGGNFNYQANGDSTGQKELIDTQKNVTMTGSTTISVQKDTALQSLNKTVAFGSLAIGNQTLTVTASNGYGVRFAGATTFNEDLPTTFNVGGGAISNVVPGLTLAGVVSSASGVGFVKTGTGALVLENAGNTFGGTGGLIDIQAGVVAAGSDGALGNAGNNVALNANSATQGFRATGTFSTSRIFSLNAASTQIEVTQGKVLTLNSGINISAVGNAFTKNNNGVLELGANSPATWVGAVTINAGAIRLKTGAGLGGSGHAVAIANLSSALQLSGTNAVYNAYPLTLSTDGTSVVTGINNGGALENVSGNNLFTGQILLGIDGTVIGSSSGTLTLNGGITSSSATARSLILAGAGNISLITTAVPALVSGITKIGAGTATLGVASTAFVGPLTVNAGTLTVSGLGRVGGTGAIAVNPGGTLTVTDSGTAIVNRLSARAITFTGGSLNLIGSGTANTSETLTPSAAIFGRGQSTITVTAGTGRQASLIFGGAVNNVGIAQSSTPSGATVLFRGTNLGTAAGANVAVITSTGGFTFDGQTGAAATTLKGILPWALVDTDPVNGVGTSFATADSGTTLIRPLAASELATILTVNANLNLSAVSAMTTTTNFNSLTLGPSGILNVAGGGLTLNPLIQVTLSSGGILALPGNGGITAGVLNAASGTPPLNIWTPGAATSLTITSTVTGGNGSTFAGLIKAGAGSLILSGPQSLAIPGLSANSLNALTSVNQGTLTLASGNNTLFPNNFVQVGPGGTLDLAGNSQYVQGLFTDGTVAGAGGIVTSSTGTGTLVANNSDTRSWAGFIQGAVAYSRSGAGTLSIYSDNSYTGITQINGSTTTLRDAGTLSGTSAIVINYATLALDNNVGTIDLPNRINDTAPITLRGATLTVQGRTQSETTETVGPISVDQGFNVINPLLSTAVVAGPNINSVEVTVGDATHGVSRPAGSSATLIIQGTNLGTIGSNSRVLTSLLNGVSTATFGGGLTNNLVGGWAESSTNEFLTYIPSLGFAPLNQPGAPGYDLAALPAGNNATKNVRLTGSTIVGTGGATVNSVSTGGVALNITFGTTTSTDILNLVSGGLIGPNNNQTIGAVPGSGRLTAGGLTPAANSDLYIFNRANTLTINSGIIDNPVANGGGSKVRAVFTASGGTITLATTTNTYTGGTVVDGGTLNVVVGGLIPVATGNLANGLIINAATVTTTATGQIAPTNVVTLNGSSTLNMFGNNTLGGLVFNNTGGTGTPVANSFSASVSGTLTLGSGNSGISATSSNVTTTSTVVGRFALPTGTTTFAIDPILFNSVQVAPTQATLSMQGIGAAVTATTSAGLDAGGITKTGDGILQFNAQSLFTGQVLVQGGGIQFGAGNAGSRFSNLNLAGTAGAKTRINLNGQSPSIGSLSGDANSVVTNSSPTGATLTNGFDDSSTTFAGRFARFGDGIPNTLNITKIGAGTLDVTGAGSDSTATLSIQGGTMRYSGAANTAFGANNVLSGGTLTLDNSGVLANNKNNRLGGTGANAVTLTTLGGTVKIIGNSATDTTETVNIMTIGTGASVLDLEPNAARDINMVVTTTFNGIQAGGTLFIKNLPTLRSSDYDPTQPQATILLQSVATPTVAFNAPAGFTQNDTELGIRPDIVAAVGSGPATAFVTKDLFNNLLRPLQPVGTAYGTPEVVGALGSGSTAPSNLDLSTVANIRENTNGYSLVLENTAGILDTAPASHGAYGPNATLLTQTLLSGGVLAIAGGSSSINVGLLTTTPVVGATPGTATNIPLTFHAYGDLAVNANVGAGTGGLTKSGGGLLTLTGRGFYTGATTINAGTFTLNGTQDNPLLLDNTIAVVPNATLALTSALAVNGGTIDLNGHNQAFGAISSNNANAGVGGTVTNSSSTPVTLISSTLSGANTSFSGAITGALSLVKTGNSTLTLTGASSYSGSTTIRGGAISLRDQGKLTGTSGVNLIYSSFTVDQTQLNPLADLNPVRLAPTVPITMLGGSLAFTVGGVTDGTATFNSISLLGGANNITSGLTQSAGSTAILNLGDIARTQGVGTTINFAANGGTLGNGGFNNPHIILTTMDGSTVATPNNIIGGWAVVSGSDFATTKASGANVEIGALGNTGFSPRVYDGTDITLATTQPTWNINDGTTRTLSTAKTINSLRVAPAAAIVLSLDTSVILTLKSGGLLTNNSATYQIVPLAGAAVAPQLTVGADSQGSDGIGNLYAFVNQNVTTIGVQIVAGDDNPFGTNLVKGGAGTLTLTASNTYGGSTIVNQGILTLSNTVADGSAAAVAVPGALIINNATTTLTVANQLRTNASVTLNGASVLNTFANNTIGRVIFNNSGGNVAPTVATASNLVLATGGVATPTITANNDVLSTTPTISGVSLTMSNATPVISTSGLSPTSLLITAPMQPFSLRSDPTNGNSGVAFGGPITKIGPGSVALNPNIALSATTDSASNILNLPAGTTTTGLAVGMSVSGTNITAGSIITQILSGSSLQLSLPAAVVATATNTMTFTGSTYTNGFNLNQGSLILAASSVLDPTSVSPTPPVINGPIGTGTLTLAQNLTGDSTNDVAILSDGTLRTLHNAVSVLGDFALGTPNGSSATALPGNGVNLAGAVTLSPSTTHSIAVNGPLNISTISGQITGNNTPLIKTGSGTLVLSNFANASTWTGAVTVAQGVLRNGADGAIADGVDLTVATGAVFDMPGLSTGLTQVLRTLSGGGAVTNSSTAFSSTLFVGGINATDTTSAVDSTFAGSISGIVGDNSGTPPAALNLTKVGAGTLTLTGENTYRGATNVNSGTLRVAISGSLRINDTISVKSGATLEVNGVVTADSGTLQTQGLNSLIRGSGKIGAGVTILSGGILEPVLNGTSTMTINNGGFLDMQAESTLHYTADNGTANRIVITGLGSGMGLPSAGVWHLKLEKGNVAIPAGKIFTLFDGDDDFTTLINGNTSSSDDKVGSVQIDFGTTGWFLNPALPADEKGVHFDFSSNSIVLIGVIPEPGTGSMVLGSLAVALGLQRFRRQRNGAKAS